MRIVILGGYGVFGGRLAELLIRDGHTVTVAGRSLAKARSFCDRAGGSPLATERGGDLAPLFATRPDIVVDAAGPFQGYGDDPYRLARACIEHGAHYFDLADDADFAAGIGSLDTAARAAGRIVISGASSVPAISSAAVVALRQGLSRVELIESAIMPGNRCPRGRSVVAAILTQVGAPLRLWRGGVWRAEPAWSDARRIALAPGLVRPASLMGAPDLALFPAHFGARSVTFRAGLELGVMHRTLALLSWLRDRRLIGALLPLVRPLHALAALLERLGTDRGGMTVDVVGDAAGGPERRRWALVAEAGDGPWIPATPVRALVRHLDRLAPGARPCLAELPLADFVAAMDGLRISTTESREPSPTLFETALGPAWSALSSEARRLHTIHDMESFSGRASVVRGTGFPARFAAAIFRFPPTGEDVPVTVTMARTATGETWERDFGGRRFRSALAASRPGHIRERFGPLVFEQALPVEDGAMRLPVRRGWLFGCPLPRVLLPRSESREFAADGRFHFDVAMHAPLGGGLIVHYRGWLVPEEAQPAANQPRPTAVA